MCHVICSFLESYLNKVNCARFYHCRICVKDFRHALERSILNRVKTEDVYEDFSEDKELLVKVQNMIDYEDSNKLVVGKMKDEKTGVAIEEFVGFKPKMYSLLVDDSSHHKKAKGVNKSGLLTISHGEYEGVLLDNECLRHSMIRFQNNNHRIRIYEINKICLSCFDDKIHILNNGYDGLVLGY